MATVSPFLRSAEGGRLMFRCPGCFGDVHTIRVARDGVDGGWTYNGNPEAPTFQPSILVRGKMIERDADGRWTGEWVRDAAGELVDDICHSFVTDGRIQFLSDCTHSLAGQTVPLLPFEGDEP